jgi:hypothetical protein
MGRNAIQLPKLGDLFSAWEKTGQKDFVFPKINMNLQFCYLDHQVPGINSKGGSVTGPRKQTRKIIQTRKNETGFVCLLLLCFVFAAGDWARVLHILSMFHHPIPWPLKFYYTFICGLSVLGSLSLSFFQYWGLNSGPAPWATPPAFFFVMGFLR